MSETKKQRIANYRARVEGNLVDLLFLYGEGILRSESFQKEKQFRQHGGYSVYDHSLAVCLFALRLAKKAKWKVDAQSLVRASLLHDYFLYDWHKKPHPKHHANLHPEYALENAKRDFGLNELEEEAIRCHMWPFHLFSFPRSKEAWLLNYADTHSALRETLGKKWLRKELGLIEKRLSSINKDK